jgi:hypothetical protein
LEFKVMRMNSKTSLACMDAGSTLSEFASRMALLSTLGYQSVLRAAIESSLLPLRAGSRMLSRQMNEPSRVPTPDDAVCFMHEASEKALFDLRNHMQNAMLIQDEAAVWTRRINERLAAVRQAAMVAPYK